MNAPAKLALYAAALAAVLGVSIVVGAAAAPIGLSNAEPDAAEHDDGTSDGTSDGMVPGLAAADAGFRFVPDTKTLPAGTRAPYEFRIVDEERVVTGFDVEHTKRMHLIVVRRDFAGFQHLHPAMRPDGTWAIPLTLDEPGVYRVYADFVVDDQKRTLATDLFVAGEFDPRPLPAPATTADAGDGYTVAVVGTPVAGEESTLDFVVRRDGQVVDDLPEYLGARGHLVALSAGDLGYLHVHADEEELSFDANFPTPGAYGLFLQFEHGGKVRTVAYTVHTETAR